MRTGLMRVIGVLNLLFGLRGVYFWTWLLNLHWHRWPGSPNRWEWLVFFLLSSISVYLISALMYLGTKLIRKDETALRRVRNLFLLEIVFFYLWAVLCSNVMPLRMSAISVGLWGIAQGLLVPQVITGYPVIGVIATAILWQTRRKNPASTSAA